MFLLFSVHIRFQIRTDTDKIASSPSDVIEASSDLDDLQDHRTYKERFDDLLQSQYLDILIQSEAQFQAMPSHAEEDRSQFDFNLKAATLYGHHKKWLLYQVRDFLLRYPNVRGTTLMDFQDELKEKTTREFDVNEVSRLIQLAGAL